MDVHAAYGEVGTYGCTTSTVPEIPTFACASDPLQAKTDISDSQIVDIVDNLVQSSTYTSVTVAEDGQQVFTSSRTDQFQEYAVNSSIRKGVRVNTADQSRTYTNGVISDQVFSPVESLQKEMNLETKDENISRAVGECIKLGSVTPLVKEELKCSIQMRRLQEGKNELHVSFSDPEKPQLTADEIKRVERRKLQGRVAAQKFRQRQKQIIEDLQKKCNSIESQNTQLRYEMRKQKQVNEQLRTVLNDHLKVCPCVPQEIFKTPRWC